MVQISLQQVLFDVVLAPPAHFASVATVFHAYCQLFLALAVEILVPESVLVLMVEVQKLVAVADEWSNMSAPTPAPQEGVGNLPSVLEYDLQARPLGEADLSAPVGVIDLSLGVDPGW